MLMFLILSMLGIARLEPVWYSMDEGGECEKFQAAELYWNLYLIVSERDWSRWQHGKLIVHETQGTSGLSWYRSDYEKRKLTVYNTIL